MGCITSTASPRAQLLASHESDFRVCLGCGALLPSGVVNCPYCANLLSTNRANSRGGGAPRDRSSAFALYARAAGVPPVPATTQPYCSRCHGPLGDRLPSGRYVCHRCGGPATPLLGGSAVGTSRATLESLDSDAALPSNGSIRRDAHLICHACDVLLPPGVLNCPYCGTLLGMTGAEIVGRGEYMEPEPPRVRNIALDDSNAALERLAGLLDPDLPTVRKILSGLAAPGGDSRNWSCPDCTFHNPADAGSCEICERLRQGDEKIIISVDDNACVAQEESKEVAGKRARDEPDDDNKDPFMDQALDVAIESISCPVCLEVYFSPLTLPCGHSLCLHHVPDMQTRACPVCRATFMQSQHRAAKNAALCRNVRTVVLLASLRNPDRETVRDARAKMRIEREELCSLGSALGLHVDASRFEEAAAGLSERFRALP